MYGNVADVVMTVSSQDGDSIREMGVDTELKWLPFIAEASKAEDVPRASSRHGLLYCSSLNPIAVAAMEWLVTNVRPEMMSLCLCCCLCGCLI